MSDDVWDLVFVLGLYILIKVEEDPFGDGKCLGHCISLPSVALFNYICNMQSKIPEVSTIATGVQLTYSHA